MLYNIYVCVRETKFNKKCMHRWAAWFKQKIFFLEIHALTFFAKQDKLDQTQVLSQNWLGSFKKNNWLGSKNRDVGIWFCVVSNYVISCVIDISF